MLFNSLAFGVFLPVAFGVYWWLGRAGLRWQNAWLACTGMFFYAWWDWRFLPLLLTSSLTDYLAARQMERPAATPAHRRAWLAASLTVNLGILAYFKYANFFTDSLRAGGLAVGLPLAQDMVVAQVLLPLGISFYTFQAISYVVDVYRGRMAACRSVVEYVAYICFFPQLVAGPIERAPHLMPQFSRARMFDPAMAVDGLRQMLWGYFKKMVVADQCAYIVADLYGHAAQHNGATLVLAAVFFSFQIYGDFSGYSDIAQGTARLFGFELMANFRYPYLAGSVPEFWRRWHISLSGWLRDYVYIPLGGSRVGRGRRVLNTLATFGLSGLWHGAGWHFVVWGLYHGALMVPGVLLGTGHRVAATWAPLPRWRQALQIVGTFGLITIGWVFFRAASLGQAVDLLSRMALAPVQGPPLIYGKAWIALGAITLLTLAEALQRHRRHALDLSPLHWPRPLRYAAYYSLIALIVGLAGQAQEFIYFQF